MAASSEMMVEVPTGVAPGGMFNVQTPSGQMMSVTCPPGVAEGEQISLPAPSDVGAVVAKLGDGFVLGDFKEGGSAPGDGETFYGTQATGCYAKEDLNDLEGNKIGEILYQSNNINRKGGEHRSARVVANDGTTLFTFDRPKASKDDKNPAYAIMLHGTTPYATATSQRMMNHVQVQLTRLDGSGGLRIGKRISKQGYLACLAFALGVPTLMIGTCIIFYLAQFVPVIITLESLDGATQFSPMLEVKGKQMVPFQSAAIPLRHAEHTKVYVEEKCPQPLDGAARIDALILFVVWKAAVTLRWGDTV